MGELRIGVALEVRPRSLPRDRPAPATLAVRANLDSASSSLPPRLVAVGLDLHRRLRLDPAAVPACRYEAIQPGTSSHALAACGGALVGRGQFAAKILIPAQSPFPSRGRILAFNGRYRGRPALLAHVYGTRPAPNSLTVAFRIRRQRGAFPTKLVAFLPAVSTAHAHVTGIALKVGAGRGERPYLGSVCPAPAGSSSTLLPLVRASFGFADAPTLRSTLSRGCRVRG